MLVADVESCQREHVLCPQGYLMPKDWNKNWWVGIVGHQANWFPNHIAKVFHLCIRQLTQLVKGVDPLIDGNSLRCFLREAQVLQDCHDSSHLFVWFVVPETLTAQNTKR